MQERHVEKITVELNPQTYDNFREYCEVTNSEKSDIMEDLVNYFLSEYMYTMDAMRKGYEEMGNLNLEICSEFEGCEDEAHSHL